MTERARYTENWFRAARIDVATVRKETPAPSAHRLAGLGRRLRRAARAVGGADGRAASKYLAETLEPKLHLGCGYHLLEGWLNTDRAAHRAGVLHLDATRPFPFPANAFAYMYSEHLLGSLSADGANAMLRECFRVLAPGGKVRIATPDLVFLAGLHGDDLSTAQRRYIEWFHIETRSLLGGHARGGTTRLPDATSQGKSPGASASLVVNHYMKAWKIEVVYDEPMLREALEAAGFHAVTRCGLTESGDEALRGLANEGRMPPNLLRLESLVLEASKSEGERRARKTSRGAKELSTQRKVAKTRWGTSPRGAVRWASRCLGSVPRAWRRADIARRHFAGTRVPKLHLGCGAHRLDGWLNTDLSPRFPDVARLDASRRFPFPDNAFAYVYSEYMLASLSFSLAPTMLSECHRVLSPGGKVRIATTDLAFLIGLYRPEHSALENRYMQWASARRMAPCRHSLCREFWRRRGAPDQSGRDPGDVPAGIFLNHHLHTDGARFVYNGPVLTEMLAGVGFTNIVRCTPTWSEDPALRGLANEARMPDGFLEMECLTLEATKPFGAGQPGRS